ncbi:MAG: hypothetical protein AAFO81_07965 [Pseudomonadota bacterium]
MTTPLRDAIAAQLAQTLASLNDQQRDTRAAEFRRHCEDYRTLARMHYFPDFADAALRAARELPQAEHLPQAGLLQVLADAYDIAAALRKR